MLSAVPYGIIMRKRTTAHTYQTFQRKRKGGSAVQLRLNGPAKTGLSSENAS